MKLQICVIIIRTRELQRERRPDQHTLCSLPLFLSSIRGIAETLSMRGIFFRRGRQSAPCSQALSSHFTRSTRWKPRKLLYFPPIGPFRRGAAEERTPGLWMATTAGEMTHGQIPVNEHANGLEHTHVSLLSQTAAWRRRPPNIN